MTMMMATHDMFQGQRLADRMGVLISGEIMQTGDPREIFSLPQSKKIAEFVGIGAVRYALVDVDATKPVVFTWDRVLNFETNSAPYVQYTHARACSILRKAAREPANPGFELLKEKLEREIVLGVAGFPDTFIEAAEYLKPR
jgi:arginyl-tRNA synthetase